MIHWIIGGIVVIAVAAGGFFFLNNSKSAMMPKDAESEAMMAKDSSAALEKDDTTIQKNEVMLEADAGESGMKKDEMMTDESAMMKGGSYESYSPEKLALANDGKVVIYFHADWCPICRSLESNINANLKTIPAGVHILKADYDTETMLKQKYGVTYQHTFAQVDAKGNLIAKWGDANTLAAVLAHVK
ncbi:hypothetical protein A2765_04505 [Candidatus Kaiserbacteria bacterium RIFCSPHIGHO2_01_FULL_56_24]|uniref:Thioredoxin domain-containing protein n=1 Tax=Candidatus Kaiserbacteria bacterium RIFCSPHIGHO2_01_FULL_56_24 TaxID=1798487 RepID=A0A1F6DER9_9BACT|nr:MAG: hypothetical protein A2765_04505 [Candidatus Kaiserbacteria bacterium RIFCSPHIGHO2_01_FULL_56_24]